MVDEKNLDTLDNAFPEEEIPFVPKAHRHVEGEPRKIRHDVEEMQLMQQELGVEVDG